MSRKSDKPAQPALGLQETSLSAPEQPSPSALTGEVCPSTNPARRGAKRGRKPSDSNSSPPRRRRRKLPPGRGALSLINSVNVILNDESDIIARALVDKTVAGNMASARLLVELACARPRSSEDDEHRQQLLSEMLADGPQWEDPPAPPDPTDPYPGESLEDYKIRRLGPNYRLAIEAESKAESDDNDPPEA
ncbi:MAG: hypothetical protein WCF30_19505 [Terracidiphilus sp.]